MDKKAKIITYIAIGVILLILIGIAVITKFSGGAPDLTAYSEGGLTAQCIKGGYSWNTLLNSVVVDALSPKEFTYNSENTLLVKPGEQVTFRNFGKDFDTYKFYQNYIKYYDADNNEYAIGEEEVPISMDAKALTITAPLTNGSYIYDMELNYHSKGRIIYGFKLVVSNAPSYKIEDILKYNDTLIGDSPRVNKLLEELPFNEFKDGIILRTSKEPYELIVYYKGLDTEKELLQSNAVALFALITNVDVITYQLDEKTIVFTRKELETTYGRDLREYSTNIEQWKQEVLYNEINLSENKTLDIYKNILSTTISDLKESYVYIDIASFEKLESFVLTEADKSKLLLHCGKGLKILVDASTEETKVNEDFKGVLIYADSILETPDGFDIVINAYYTATREEKITYKVLADGTIVK